MTAVAATFARGAAVVRSRPRHVLLAVYGAGVCLALAGDELTVLLAAGVAALGTAISAPRLGLLAAGALACGTLVGNARLDAIDGAGASLRTGDAVSGSAFLVGPPTAGPFGDSVELRLTVGRYAGARLLARLPSGEHLPRAADAGLGVSVSGAFRKAGPAREPGGFDLGAYLKRRGVAGELIAERVRPDGHLRGGVAGVTDGMRRRADAALTSGLSPPAAALVRGMVLGEDERIDEGVVADYRASGLAHVLAVSGQNVMLLCALALAVLAGLGLPRSLRLSATIVLVALYVPIAGSGPSVQRAGVMGVAGLIALAASRPASRWYTLLLAAAATLTLNPRTIGDPGWQLSFAAVAGILVLGTPLRSALTALPRALADGVALTVAATLATAPLMAHHFGVLSLASLPSNVAALGVVAPIMWMGMLRAALGQVAGGVLGPPANALNDLLGWGLEPLAGALSWIASTFAQMRGAQLAVGLRSPFAVAAAYVALAFLCAVLVWLARRGDVTREIGAAYWRRLPGPRRIAAVIAVAAGLGLCLHHLLAAPAAPDALTISYLDVGQGDSTLIQDRQGTAVLFDGGPPEAQVDRLLRRAGVKRLALVVMTHQSRDHQGGLLEVVRHYPVDLLLENGDGTRDPAFRQILREARDRGIRELKALAPMRLRAGELSIRVLSPPPRTPGPPPEDPNPRAVVAIVSSQGFDLMLSGDAESPTLNGLHLPDVEAIKVPHHGSSDPGLPRALRMLRPAIAGIEVGAHNTYGHPTASTLDALRRAHVSTYRTDQDGTVRLTVQDGRVSVHTEH